MNQFVLAERIIVGLLLIGLLVSNLRYRRQIREICRQLAFHRRENSNQEIRIDVHSGEIMQLQREINELYRSSNEILTEYQNADKTLKDMITNISHDIRTPLTSIDGFFQLLCETQDEDEKRRYTEIIQNRIKALGAILEQLFTYVHIQNSSMQIEMKKCDIKQCLCENLFSFYEDFKKQGIEPEVHLTEEPVYVLLDELQMARVIQNILKNALVHGDARIIVSLEKVSSKILLHIRNHTNEQHSEKPELVFERFFQGDKARNTQSSGLGLCIAKELVEQMHGSIRAYYQDDYFGIEIAFEEMEKQA
ncbi:MAG TPA: HAMP domain-containing sensor histidine kinase [Lachnospiraceae bacterium]|jgi:signal transduction histidine kinase|nr:HAMP domain-containing sensor histidine kinase [Lachnospiraceae bacterium]